MRYINQLIFGDYHHYYNVKAELHMSGMSRTGTRFKCTHPNCTRTFKNKTERNFHSKNICNKPLRWKCGHCDYRSFCAGHIRRHSRSKHKNLEPQPIELYNPHLETRKYRCPNPNCDKKYKQRANLVNHINHECDKEPRFKCFYCDFKNAFEPRIMKHCRDKHSLQIPRSVTMMK
ncbi:histone H4 transcription factor-like [Cotesia glomerata]|uniref:histone H4 transcription factor-like n=1 Tax=Cotesia glomerata TaxID=32391 RepID=UPI001D00C602|nr:histone H4 transcription factor-like [Cotesia glomerata]